MWIYYYVRYGPGHQGQDDDFISFSDEDLEINFEEGWGYAKMLDCLGDVIDAYKLTKWAGESMFSIEMEY